MKDLRSCLDLRRAKATVLFIWAENLRLGSVRRPKSLTEEVEIIGLPAMVYGKNGLRDPRCRRAVFE